MRNGTEAATLPMARVRVWDPWVRLVHWSMLGLLALSWWSAETGRMDLHMTSGLSLLALILFRLAWGFLGSANARFRQFLRWPSAGLRHLRHVLRREPDRETTHNAAGGWMVVLLLALVLTQAMSGLFADDQVFTRGPLARSVPGEVSDWFSRIHLLMFDYLLAAVALHVAVIALYRVAKGQDLVTPMITGIKRLPIEVAAAAPRLAPAWLAVALLAGAAAIALGIARLG